MVAVSGSGKIRFPGEFFEGAGLDLDAVDCQSTGVDAHAAFTPFDYPWRDEQHEADKTKAFRFVRERQYIGEYTTLAAVVKHVYGTDYSNTEYRRLSRFVERADWLAKHDSAGSYVAVEATPEAFKQGDVLNSSKASAKNARGEYDSDVKRETGSKTGGKSVDVTVSAKGNAVKSHRDRAKQVVDNSALIHSASLRSDVTGQFVAWRESVADTYSIFKSTQWWKDDDEYLILPYLSRFNDSDRARKTKERLYGALRRSVKRFDVATLLTLTVDPKRVGSQSEAMERLTEQWQKFNSRLNYQMGGSVPKIRGLEFQENGMPHLHVALFGVRKVDGEPTTGEATISTEQVRQWWDDEYDVGSQIAVQPVRKRGDRWLLHDSDDSRVSLRYYLGKASRRLLEVASMSERQLAECVASDDLGLWEMALYWVHERQFVSCSPSLKADTGDESGLPHVTRWEYVGSAKYDQIPRGVLQRATIFNRGRRPSPTGGSDSSAVATP